MTEFQELPRGNEMLATQYPNLLSSHLVCLVSEESYLSESNL